MGKKKKDGRFKKDLKLGFAAVHEVAREFDIPSTGFGISIYAVADQIIERIGLPPFVGRKNKLAVILKWSNARAVKPVPKTKIVSVKQVEIDAFYLSWEWARVRYDFLATVVRRCLSCGATPSDGVRIVVDHIKPIRYFWELRLDPKNLQCLCDLCNKGKGSRDQTDFRQVEVA